MDNFNIYSIQIDAECFSQDFDSIDLYGEKLESNDNDNDTDLVLE